MANVLPRGKQEMVLKLLVDGSSIRAAERITDIHRDTIMRLMVRVGDGCARPFGFSNARPSLYSCRS